MNNYRWTAQIHDHVCINAYVHYLDHLMPFLLS